MASERNERQRRRRYSERGIAGDEQRRMSETAAAS